MGITQTPAYLRIRLEGSFCVVIQKNKSYKIRACTPVDLDHQLVINNKQIEYKEGDSFHFELKPDGLASYNRWPDVDPAFDWSNKTTSKWENDDSYYFITMDLPCPQRIMQDCTARVTFRDNGIGLMPLNHILVYEIENLDEVEIASKELGSQEIDDSGIFQLELGLALDTPAGTVHDHAIMFYNEMLQEFFPDLYSDPKCCLKDIQVNSNPGESILTTTLECKSGGLIVGVPQ